MRPSVLFTSLLFLGVGLRAQAQTPPPYQSQRQNEDYSYLKDPSLRTDFWDPLKFIALDHSADSWLSLGADVRERYEIYGNRDFGRARPDNGYLLQRYLLYADLHLANTVRVFGQLQSSVINFNRNSPGPADADRLGYHQLFGDFAIGRDGVFRFGRQELVFGSSRLIDNRDGATVRQSFDGFRLILQGKPWRVDLLAVRPVTSQLESFGDRTDYTQSLWGIYAVTPFGVVPGGNVDLYYLGRTKENATYNQGTATDNRQTVGARIWGSRNRWDYDWEFTGQFGAFGDEGIHAWSIATSTGYLLGQKGWKPRLAFKAGVTSGDQGGRNGQLNTFDPLFPTLQTFNLASMIWPSNIVDVHPELELHPTSRLTSNITCDFLWRESAEDGLYGPGESLVRPAGTSRALFVGVEPSIISTYSLDRHTSLLVSYAHHFCGPYLQDNPPAKGEDYFTAWVSYRF